MEDRLSILPDPILCHILSFLPTEVAIATSVLSKRWKPLWRSVPTLDFDYIYESKEANSRFIQSVYAFIFTRDQRQPFHKFRIRLWAETEESEEPTNVAVWLNFAAQRQLQHLEICLFNHRVHSLPPPTIPPDIFFTCSTNLVVLKLHGLSLKPLSSVDFPFLKTLHLQTSLFLEYECLALLLSRCPLLQDFKASSRLFFIYNFSDGIHSNCLPVQFFHIRQINNQVLHHHESTNISAFTMFRNLTHMEFSNIMCNKDWLNIVEMLKYCPKLQVLVINQQHDLIYENIQFEVDLRDWQCSLPGPECIQLHLKRCYLNDYRGTEGEFQFARYILQNGRVLESMIICSFPDVKQQEKHENLKKLSSCTRLSPTCELLFDERETWKLPVVCSFLALN
ncbi:FBD-associated F-box protein At3g52670-like [Lotus japonicus]|uniref:FBD-associated F-box protein At3g52670-like n=1 Tax=Lotus japonicus TaxID=34305 RepID=UPI00258FC662|nr:FBD-associated F-box protein At3g52670-like [Lotus japonicus]